MLQINPISSHYLKHEAGGAGTARARHTHVLYIRSKRIIFTYRFTLWQHSASHVPEKNILPQVCQARLYLHEFVEYVTSIFDQYVIICKYEHLDIFTKHIIYYLHKIYNGA